MVIDVSPDELGLLKAALDRALVEYEHELVRTDAPDLQHSLSKDLERLTGLRRRLDAEAPSAESPSRAPSP
jgi:hypothetical protein